MITTEKTRKQSQTQNPENRSGTRSYRSPAKRGKSPTIDFYKSYEKRLKILQEVQEEQEKRLKILQEILESAQKSTAESFYFQDLEKSIVYRYGICITRLRDLFKTDQDVQDWLNSHESGLPKTPMQYLEEGKFEIVERLIGMIEYGIPS